MNYLTFKSTHFLHLGLASTIAELCWRCFFLFSVRRRDAGSSLARPLSPRVAGQSWTPPAPHPPSLGRALVLRGPPSAAMASEMEPLLLAWSYFRRRKFQLCADLCTQMLEKSPYDQVLAGPRQPCASRR